MNNGKQKVILLLDDEAALLDGLSSLLEADDRRIVTCRDLESAQIILETIPVSCIVSDIRLSSPFAFEGLDLIHHAGRHAPHTPLILMSGNASDELRREAIKRGAVELLAKPFEIDQLEQLMTGIEPRSWDGLDRLVEVPVMDEILSGPLLVPKFQPIVTFDGAAHIYGFEALARYRSGWPFANPELLFAYGERKQRLTDLEIALVRASLTVGAELARRFRLFMNIHPLVASEGKRLIAAILEESERHQIPRDHLVIEITEQAAFQPTPGSLEMLDVLQAAGVEFALDDVGVAHSHLAHLDQIRPRYMKISQVFGTGFEDDVIKHKLVRNFLSLARDFSAELILEGVESARTIEVAQGLGINLLQGYHFARPGDAAHFAPAFESGVIG